MESKFIRPLIALGIPGVALGIFYLLFKKFDFKFSQVDSTWTTVIVLVFLSIVAAVTFFALHRWAPVKSEKSSKSKEGAQFEFCMGEEKVTFLEKMASLSLDVVKINAHSHYIGIAAEYAWLDHKYAGCERLMQSLTALELTTGTGQYKPGQVHFDVIKIKLKDGREKEIYFDISSFFDGKTSSLVDRDDFVSKKISELYL